MLEVNTENRSKPYLLLVDDQSSVIMQLNEIFKQDYDVFMTTESIRAVDLCLSLQPDLILLDVMMPHIDGYELCRKIKANPQISHIPIIFITASDDESGEVLGFNLGAVDYLHKPIDSQIALARVKNQIQLKKQSDKLRSLALIDGLTGIGNRAQLDEKLQANWLACARDQHPLALLMIDIDFFKDFNDLYGHIVGDECIKLIARCIAEQLVRPRDTVARFGGEEFLCILPDTELNGALTVAQHILQSVENLQIRHENSQVSDYVTISIGVATAIPQHQGSYNSLVKAADTQLYHAKSQGRNRVCSSA